MDGPPHNPRICAIAKRISPLPPEVISPIIADQQLHRVLELSLVPTAGPRLLWAIKNSLQWKWLFVREDGVNQMEEFRQLFQSANFLSWMWCRQVAMQVPSMARRYHLNADSGSKATSLEQFQQDFLSVFLDILPLPANARWRLNGLCHTEFESMARFLPKDILTRIESSETPEHMQIPSLEQCMRSKESIVELASAVINHKWTTQQAQNFLPYLAQALKLQGTAKSQELLRLADLKEVFPAELKEPFAPQDFQDSATQHILSGLRRDAQRMLIKPICTSGKISSSHFPKPRGHSYRFRYPHPALVPADWVLRLICTMVERYPLPEDGNAAEVENKDHSLRYPPELIPDLRQCIEGMPNILQYTGISEYARYKQLGAKVTHISYLKKTKHTSPHCYAELDWLEALLRCVNWIKGEAPELVQECLKVPADTSGNRAGTPGIGKDIQTPVIKSLLEYDQLLTREDYEAYVAGESAEVIAQQLRLDSSLDSGHLNQLPSLLALYLPRIPAERARDIAACLLPGADRTVREVMYQDMMKKAIATIRRSPDALSPQDFERLRARPEIGASTADLSAEGTWEVLREYVASQPARTGGPFRYCYVCQMIIQRRHKVFPSMCEPCGEFNIAGSAVSLPPNLKLDGQVAVVTGGRINLGFHTALRLLRCGAAVIVSTRYPEDAVTRYNNERDSSVWRERLKIIGADFRAASDAFQLVEQVRNLVGQMGGVLHILINNAAQTLTDSREKEQDAVSRERLLKGQEAEKSMLVTHSYEPRVRGVTDHHLIESASTGGAKFESTETVNVSETDSKTLANRETDSSLSVTRGEDGPSSWMQTLADIPYEDIISAHSVNTFVPLILIRELMPLMKPAPARFRRGRNQRMSAAYIVNVSSREGIFEKSAKSASKRGKHVHTNMSKAGLNMITETEAYSAWRLSRVAMNTVDPGYMSAAPECEQSHGGERPIGWEDGAGRVLWPIAIGEGFGTDQGSEPIWGRFLKHYGATRVDVRLGRG